MINVSQKRGILVSHREFLVHHSNIAGDFADRDGFIIKIIVPSGTRCLFIHGISEIEFESEIIFDRDSIFQIIDPIRKYDDQKHMTIKYMGSSPKENMIVERSSSGRYVKYEKLNLY